MKVSRPALDFEPGSERLQLKLSIFRTSVVESFAFSKLKQGLQCICLASEV